MSKRPKVDTFYINAEQQFLEFLEFPIRGERLFRIQPRYTVMLVSTYFLAEVLGEKAAL